MVINVTFFFKKEEKIFGGKKKCCTFALPIETNGM